MMFNHENCIFINASRKAQTAEPIVVSCMICEVETVLWFFEVTLWLCDPAHVESR